MEKSKWTFWPTQYVSVAGESRFNDSRMKQKHSVSMNSLIFPTAQEILPILKDCWPEVCPPPDPKLGCDSVCSWKHITASRIETLKLDNSARSQNSKQKRQAKTMSATEILDNFSVSLQWCFFSLWYVCDDVLVLVFFCPLQSAILKLNYL